MELIGLNGANWQVEKGEAFKMSYVWRSLAPVARDYQVFVHFVGVVGGTLFQQDHEPVGGAYPTGQWAPGDIVRETFLVIVPPDAPPGAYEVVVGVWDPATGVRLPVTGSDGDAVKVGTLAVRSSR